jgi:hypothetical protein
MPAPEVVACDVADKMLSLILGVVNQHRDQ